MSKSSFAANIRKSAKTSAKVASPNPTTKTPVKTPNPLPEKNVEKKTSTVAPSRQGKKGVVTYIDDEGVTHLKVFCAKNKISQQQLVLDALNEYFIKRNEPGIF